MDKCQFHDPETGDECRDEPADYGITYAMGDGYLRLKVCRRHWEYYLGDMQNFISDNEDGWAKWMKATR